MRTQHEGMAISYHAPGNYEADAVVLPLHALKEFERRGNGVVALEASGECKVNARWEHAGRQRNAEYESVKAEALPRFPVIPAHLAEMDHRFLKGLDEAMRTAAQEDHRFAVNKVQLRGRLGEIVATDGQQLLLQSGFPFGWSEDVLLPRVTIFGWDVLYEDERITTGKTKDHVCICAGSWTIFLPIDSVRRLPSVENVIPRITENCTHLHIDVQDAEELTAALPRLPGNDEEYAPVTFDLNGQVAVRARSVADQTASEIILTRSRFTGQATRFATNRHHIDRALRLGFADAYFSKPEAPALFSDDKRKYVFMPLAKQFAVAHDGNTQSSSREPAPAAPQNPPLERSEYPVRTSPIQGPEAAMPSENGHKSGFSALLEEAQSLQNILRDALLRTNQLLSGLKQHRRQAKTMQSTLATLRQLEHVDG